MSWMTKDDEISILKNEVKELNRIKNNLVIELKRERELISHIKTFLSVDKAVERNLFSKIDETQKQRLVAL